MAVLNVLEEPISMRIMNAPLSLNVLIEQHHVATKEIVMLLLMPVFVIPILQELIVP